MLPRLNSNSWVGPGAVTQRLQSRDFERLSGVDCLSSGVGDQPGQHGKTPSPKNTKVRRAWWHATVVPATQEAEVGGWLEPGTWRLQGAEFMPLHSSLGDRARLHRKKKKRGHFPFPFINSIPVMLSVSQRSEAGVLQAVLLG